MADARYVTYRTLESISTRHHHHHHHHQLPSANSSWKQHLADDMVENGSMYVVDEIEDECFHTSDFEPFSDDDELELGNRLMALENHYQCASDISSLDYSLFEPLKPVVAAKKYASGCKNGTRFCSGLIYLREPGRDGESNDFVRLLEKESADAIVFEVFQD